MFWVFAQGCSAIAGIFLFFVFNEESSAGLIEESTVKLVYGVFTSLCGVGVVLMALLRAPTPAPIEESSAVAEVAPADEIGERAAASTVRRPLVTTHSLAVSPLHALRLASTAPVACFMLTGEDG